MIKSLTEKLRFFHFLRKKWRQIFCIEKNQKLQNHFKKKFDVALMMVIKFNDSKY